MILMAVLLPAPFGPSKPNISPLPMVKETPFTASFLSKVLIRSITWTRVERPSFGVWIGPVLEKLRVVSSKVVSPSCFHIVDEYPQTYDILQQTNLDIRHRGESEQCAAHTV